MGAEVHNQGRHESARIDMTPMVDCVLVLVIFLVVSSAFVQDPGVEVQKPDVRASEVAERNALLIAITADNRIYFDGQEVRIEQVSPLVQKAAFGQELPLIIRADKACSHGVFSAVYTEAKRAGVAHVQFATAFSDVH
ncbi:MAG: biopolymer transporter ExbD [Opitutaceae bacterium]|jgi:biopolymer transport protein ExbD